MVEKFEFSFENDYQKLYLQVQNKEGSVSYKVLESFNIDFIPVSTDWISFKGDCQTWLNAFIALRTNEWDAFYADKANSVNNANDINSANAILDSEFHDIDVKWSLSVEYSKDVPSANATRFKCSSKGLNVFPENFTDFLELLKLLLDIPVFLIEL